MGREIRKVPPNWQHPTFVDDRGKTEYEPMSNPRYWTEEPTWFQLYETVTDGTPLSPPFATKDELIFWLTNNENFWGYRWTQIQAERIVNQEWMPSMIVQSSDDGIVIVETSNSIKMYVKE